MNAALDSTDESLHLPGKLQLAVGQHSIAGCKTHNEDAIGIRLPDNNLLTTKGAAAIIADGVSSAEAGQEASHTCVCNFLSDYYSTPETWTVKHSAQQVITSLNRWLYSRGRGFSDSSRGYVTTLCAVVFKSRLAHIFHAGDSRVYLLRNGELRQLTRDHSTPISRDQTYLTRAVGLDVRLDMDYHTVALERDDLFLLSTDGLHQYVGTAAILSLLEAGGDLQQQCQQLTTLALENDSDDNISCQLLRVGSLPDECADEVIERLTQLQFPPLLEPGLSLDGYRVERELYASTRSQVYLVTDIVSGRRLCMKTPSVNFEDDAAYIERFVMESWIGRRINSPYVVKVVETTRPRSCLYYLTEHIDGVTLAQWMRENPRPPIEEAVFLIEQIGKGLQAFHRRETLHQDLKPDNILIAASGQVKIIDFGSCHIGGIAEIDSPLAADRVLGTATYAAPEYRFTLAQAATTRADLFSLAVISFEMLTGRLPFAGELENCKTRQDFLATRYTESFKLNPLVPHWLDTTIRKSLRLQEQQRHGDVAEFIYELSHPNPKYLEYRHRPLLQRLPSMNWKLLAMALVLSQLLTLAMLLKP